MKIIYTDNTGNALTESDLSEPTMQVNPQVLKAGAIEPRH